MAVIKHLANHNGNRYGAIEYLAFKHDEFTGKALRDENGLLILRDEFLMDGINCEALEYPLLSKQLCAEWGKDHHKGDIAAHHYIISYDPRDKGVGLSFEEAHKMSTGFARKWFPGHYGVVFSHPDGHNETGNLHSHIVICSVRAFDEPQRDWMTTPAEWKAGGKHHVTNDWMRELKQGVMDMCRQRNLHQVDLISPSKEKVSNKEFWAQRRLDTQLAIDGKTPHGEQSSTRQTNLSALRNSIREACNRASSPEDFHKILNDEHGVEVKFSRGRISYRQNGHERFTTGRRLGLDYEWPIIQARIQQRALGEKPPQRIGLISQIDDAMRSRSHAYVRKVRSSNIRKLSESIAFIKQAGFKTREQLEQACVFSCKQTDERKAELDAIEAKIVTINRAIKASGTYLSYRDLWKDYRQAPNKKAFYQAHKKELESCNQARKQLAEIFPDGKIPSLSELKKTRQELEGKRNTLYERWTGERYRSRELQTAKRNVDIILGDDASNKTRSERE